MTLAELKELKIHARVSIARPLPEVYRAVVEPERLNEFFTTTSTVMKVGEPCEWSFPDGLKSNVVIKELDMNRKVVFEWEAKKEHRTHVSLAFERGTDGRTVVIATEKGWKADLDGLHHSYDHRGLWEHVLLCLKAWLEHKVDLRK